MHSWQMQEAKARLSELVKRAQSEGPQDITVHGESVAVVISRETYERLFSPAPNLVAFIRSSPLYGLEPDAFGREDSLPRDLAL